MKTLGVIGCGNMGGAILKALIDQKIFEKENVLPADIKVTDFLKGMGFESVCDNRKASSADVILLAVKPQMLAGVLAEIKQSIDYNRTLIISIAPGFTLEMLEQMLSTEAHIVRCMPNTPAMVNAGMTAACFNQNVTEQDKADALRILAATGEVETVPEKLIDTVVGISGSAPAYVFMFIEAIADAGVRGGMTKAQALKFATQAVFGSAKLAKDTGTHPAILRDMVCSPGGTTIEAVAVLEKEGFRAAVMDCIKACSEKSAQMGKK